MLPNSFLSFLHSWFITDDDALVRHLAYRRRHYEIHRATSSVVILVDLFSFWFSFLVQSTRILFHLLLHVSNSFFFFFFFFPDEWVLANSRSNKGGRERE